MKNSPKNRVRGFTLLELLVVVAILAIISGGLLVAYNGLEGKASQGTATFNMGALDNAIRTFASINNGVHPSDFDTMLYSSGGSGTDGTALNLLGTSIRGKLGTYSLSSKMATTLSNSGITSLRYVSGTATNSAGTYSNSVAASLSGIAIPNRVFDVSGTGSSRGWGVSLPVTAGLIVPVVETIGVSDMGPFGGSPQATTASYRLHDMVSQLDPTKSHLVVALGIGNNCTLVDKLGTRNAGISEAPTYGNSFPYEYSRFIALYHLGTDTAGDGFTDADISSKAQFLTVIDSHGDWMDEEFAESKAGNN